MVTFTICTNWVAPTAPLVSGGTKANPKTLRLSSALWPSKLASGVMPVNGPANGNATTSECGLLNGWRVARAFGDWVLLLLWMDLPPTICESGREVSCDEALITSGFWANADAAQIL